MHLGRQPLRQRKIQVQRVLQIFVEALNLFWSVCNGLCVEFQIKKCFLYVWIVSGLAPSYPWHHCQLWAEDRARQQCSAGPEKCFSWKRQSQTVKNPQLQRKIVTLAILCSSFTAFFDLLFSNVRTAMQRKSHVFPLGEWWGNKCDRLQSFCLVRYVAVFLQWWMQYWNPRRTEWSYSGLKIMPFSDASELPGTVSLVQPSHWRFFHCFSLIPDRVLFAVFDLQNWSFAVGAYAVMWLISPCSYCACLFPDPLKVV